MGRPKIYDRDAVLHATTQVFWQKGLAETTLSDIEKCTGVNKSSLYTEFLDKEDIFTASIEHYIQTGGVLELLNQKPLGKKNLLEFLKLGKSCSGQRGCFVANSLREFAILPDRAKELIQSHFKKIKAQITRNIRATKFSGNPEKGTDLILTFNAGLCLELNATKESQEEKIDAFVSMLGI
jgi:AcrR family transcriptional regulator